MVTGTTSVTNELGLAKQLLNANLKYWLHQHLIQANLASLLDDLT